MRDHDPLCPLYGNRPWGTCDLCDLIAKVRADERSQTIREAMHIRARQQIHLRAKVAALPCAEIDDADPCAYVKRADVLALFDGGRR